MRVCATSSSVRTWATRSASSVPGEEAWPTQPVPARPPSLIRQVAYESDLRQVRETLEGTVENLEWRSQTKRPKVYLHEFADSAVTYHINVWIDDANDARQRSSDLREAVWWALKDKNITIA